MAASSSSGVCFHFGLKDQAGQIAEDQRRGGSYGPGLEASVLMKGVKEAVDEQGVLGLFAGGFKAGAIGTSAALILEAFILVSDGFFIFMHCSPDCSVLRHFPFQQIKVVFPLFFRPSEKVRLEAAPESPPQTPAGTNPFRSLPGPGRVCRCWALEMF